MLHWPVLFLYPQVRAGLFVCLCGRHAAGSTACTAAHRSKHIPLRLLIPPMLYTAPLCPTQYMQSDFIRDFHEHKTMKEQLGDMFPPKADAVAWDRDKE